MTTPGYDSGTMHLMRALKPQSEKARTNASKVSGNPARHRNIDVAKLIKVRDAPLRGDVYYDDVTLTMKGEAESIKPKSAE